MCLVATEDELSEAVLVRLLAQRGVGPERTKLLRRNGNGYLRSRFTHFLDAASNGRNVLVLTDLDRLRCAPSLVQNWYGDMARQERLLLRVAVREVEAWLLADDVSFLEFIGSPRQKIQKDVEAIADPKLYLLNLAKRGRRDIRNDLLPRAGVLAYQGFGYNQRLSEFVSQIWCPERASEKSDSLRRAIDRIDDWIASF